MVIPVFNDRDSLEVLLKKIDTMETPGFHFLIVDNGSTDLELSTYLENGGTNWSSIRTPQNLGFGGGIMFGIKASSTAWVGWMPGNLKIDPLDVPNFISQINFDPNSLIKARRVGRTIVSSSKTLFAGMVQTIMLRKNMLDTGGTPTVCTREFIERLLDPPKDYIFESFILHSARSSKLNVQRPKINYGKRMFGQSHWQNGLTAEMALMRDIVISSRNWN